VRISTIANMPAGSLGLAAYPEQNSACVGRAFESGINFFFFYSPGQKHFVKSLQRLVATHRNELIVASGSGSRTTSGLRAARHRIASIVGVEVLDIFFAEYINPNDHPAAIFDSGGVLDELQNWKAEGSIRYVGTSCHDRKPAKRLAEDPRVDLLMHRFNMAHHHRVESGGGAVV
jgi:aryl-alcohol dehydrogenase-like predicted oxidoreductase